MRRRSFVLLAALAAALAPAAAHAQSSAAGEEAAVRAVIDRMFDGMRQADSAMVRGVMHESARLQTTDRGPDGQARLRVEPIENFLRAVGTPRTAVWDERISNVRVQVDDNLATAWMDYGFFVDGRFSHCGVNAFQLFRSADGWKVIQIADTRRRQGCPQAAAAN